MKNEAEIRQDDMETEDEVPEAIPRETTHMPIGPSSSTPHISSSSQNLGSLVDLFSLGPLSDTDMQCISNNNTETFINIHNRALEKFSRIATGEYFCMCDRFDRFHGLPTQYNHLGWRGDLILVRLSDLAVGKSYELRVMYGELCVDPFRFGRIYTVMKEADTKNGIALSIVGPDFLFTDQYYAKRAYPKGTKIAVKQPRLFQAPDGFKWINVDNPRSIVRIERFPENIPLKFEDWFKRGGRAHDTEDWEACVRNYSKCEIIFSQTARETIDEHRMDLRFELHSKRSRAYIALARYSEALQDALTCSTIYCHLRDSPQKEIDQFHLEIESLIALGQKCIEYYRMGESIVGIAKNPRDCKPDADYIGPVVVQNTDTARGRGLFTTEFVKSGTVLLICRAFSRCDDSSYPLKPADMANSLFRNVRNAIRNEGERALLLFLSFEPSRGNQFKTILPDLQDFVTDDVAESSATSQNMFIRGQYEKIGTEGILRILKTIAFDDMSPENINNLMTPDQDRRYYGIWLIPSLINHSCLPNASRINVGDLMSIHATKDIDEGEEITIPYFNVVLPYRVRQAACKTWGFYCLCKRCQLELVEVPLADSKRIYAKFYTAYLEAALSKTNGDADQSNIDVEAMAKLSDEMDGWLESLGEVSQEQNSMWIRSSFILLYLARVRLNLDECVQLKYEENSYRKYLYNLTIAKEALLGTCSGDIL